jgi:predicted transcriptional regulator
MRTTITIEDDLAARLDDLQRREGLGFKEAVNQTLRAGLERLEMRPATIPRFKVKARKMGLRPGLNYANVGELIEQLEGADHR